LTKVIIISYFYPPANFVGGDRADSWTKYLPQKNIYPIVITRNWNDNQKDLTDIVINNDYSVTKTDTHEIHRLPVKNSLRDQIAQKKGLSFIQKALTFGGLLRSNFSLYGHSSRSFYDKACELIEEHNDIKAVIVSGRPFFNFNVGHLLKRKYQLLWIPDYRDDWTTRVTSIPVGILQKILYKLEQKNELKWTENADFFIAATSMINHSIGEYIGKTGYTITNGYDLSEIVEEPTVDLNKPLTMTYIGTLYAYQPMVDMIEVYKSAIDNGADLIIRFIGIDTLPAEKEKVIKAIEGYEKNFQVIDRIPKEELKDVASDTDYFFLTGYNDFVSSLPVKLFNYLAFKKPIVLYLSDKGIMRDFIRTTKSGYVIEEPDQLESLLRELDQKKRAGEAEILNIDNPEFHKYSREYQASLLGDLLSDKVKTVQE
jgi:glycosyltransferase involved in cell wall biosynthesis